MSETKNAIMSETKTQLCRKQKKQLCQKHKNAIMSETKKRNYVRNKKRQKSKSVESKQEYSSPVKTHISIGYSKNRIAGTYCFTVCSSDKPVSIRLLADSNLLQVG